MNQTLTVKYKVRVFLILIFTFTTFLYPLQLDLGVGRSNQGERAGSVRSASLEQLNRFYRHYNRIIMSSWRNK